MPVPAMLYTRGKAFKSESSVAVVKHSVRVVAEPGADHVKVNHSGCAEAFQSVVEGCVVSIGRNVFQHKDPTRMIQAIKAIIHEDASVEAVTTIL